MKIICLCLFLFIVSGFYCFSHAQSNGSRPNRGTYSNTTITILFKMDSLLGKAEHPELEFRTVGEASAISKIYLVYIELAKNASLKEIFDLINNKNENSIIRGYAYMAYLYQCNLVKNPHKWFNYNFKIPVLRGCIGNIYTFSEFQKILENRPCLYNPSLCKTIENEEEKNTIINENKIRKEQGVPIRQDTL